jgi:uncharacterized protein YbjQ (UPF0145 family)
MASPPPEPDEELRLQEGAEALASGRLPAHVRERLAGERRRGTWSSNLSVAQLAAIRSVGFVPCGQVMGSSVFQIGWQGTYACQRYWGARRTELLPYSNALRYVRSLALYRMLLEAVAVDAHGVVGVRVTFRDFPETQGIVEYTAIGTAIHRRGAQRLKEPFLSGVDGEGFAKLLRSGLVPCGLAQGLCTVHVHLGPAARMQGWQTGEVAFLPDSSAFARSRACAQLAEGIGQLRGDGAVGSSTAMRVWRTPCRARPEELDYVVQFTAEGTAVARFERPEHPRPSPVIHLR